tara:strand:- start:44 stop:235 length:192 start_codon:yes stop_codon:yes gene_type:complete
MLSENEERVYTIVDILRASKYRMTLPMILEYLNEDRNPEWEDYDETDWREGLAELSMTEEFWP